MPVSLPVLQVNGSRRFQNRILGAVCVVLLSTFIGSLSVAPCWGQALNPAADVPDPVVHEQGAGKTPAGAGMQAASLGGTIPYGAAKLGMALVGGLAGAIGFALSGDLDGAKEIWDATMKGTYVLSPEHLSGEEDVTFYSGPTE